MDQNTSVTALHDMMEFYNNAWTMLISALTVLLAIGAGAIPLFSIWIQRRALKLQERSIAAKIEQQLQNEETRLLKAVRDEADKMARAFREQFDVLAENFERRAAYLETGIFMVQAKHMRSEGNLANAVASYANGVKSAIRSGREDHVQNCVNLMVEALGEINADQLSAIPDDFGTPEKVVEILKANNADKRYVNSIRQISRAIEGAKARAAGSTVPPVHGL